MRELGDREDGAADLRDVEVHLPLLVLEDAQLDGLPRRLVHRVGPVARLDAPEDEKASPDLSDGFAADPDGGAGDALKEEDHRVDSRRGASQPL